MESDFTCNPGPTNIATLWNKTKLPKDWEEWISLAAAAADADVAADFELKDVADVAEVEDLRVCDDADDAADADEE